jgi:hypothetical protein
MMEEGHAGLIKDHLDRDLEQQQQDEEKALDPLIDAISRKWAPNLVELDLSCNRVGTNSFRRLAEQCFKAVEGLEKIDVSGNEPEHDMEHEDVEEFRRGARMHDIEIKADFQPKPDIAGKMAQAKIDLARFKSMKGGMFSGEDDAEGGLPDGGAGTVAATDADGSLAQAQAAADAAAPSEAPLLQSQSEPIVQPGRMQAPPPTPSQEAEQGMMMAPAAAP